MRRCAQLAFLATTLASCGRLVGVSSNDDAPPTLPPPLSDAGPTLDAAGEAATDADVDAAPDATTLRKRVFVTSTVYAGNDVASSFLATGGCQALADSHGFGGTFVPWLALAGNSPITIVGSGPWYDLARDRLIATSADLVSMDGGVAIVEDEVHGTVDADYVWTGTHGNGTVGPNCMDWSSTEDTGVAGASGFTGWDWTETAGSPFDCNAGGHIYCFEK